MSEQSSTYAHNKIMEFFYSNPTAKLHLRELARRVGLSPTGAAKILKRLVAAKLIIKESTSAATFYTPNYDNGQFFLYKKASNLFKLQNSDLLHHLIDVYKRPECILVFGSYADGTDTESSDIDILVVTTKKLRPDLSKFENEFNREINLIETELTGASKGFKNNIANGTVLFGFLEVAK